MKDITYLSVAVKVESLSNIFTSCWQLDWGTFDQTFSWQSWTFSSSGATCSGKTSLASLLEKVLPRAAVVNLDKYYYEEDSSHHVRDNKTNFINWEVLQAFNMNQMHRDILDLQEKVKYIFMSRRSLLKVGHTQLKLTERTSTVNSEVEQLLRNSHHQPLLHLARETLTPILIVEGLPRIISLQFVL